MIFVVPWCKESTEVFLFTIQKWGNRLTDSSSAPKDAILASKNNFLFRFNADVMKDRK